MATKNPFQKKTPKSPAPSTLDKPRKPRPERSFLPPEVWVAFSVLAIIAGLMVAVKLNWFG